MATKMTVDQLYQKMSEIGLDGWIANEEGEILREEIERVPNGGVYLEVGVAYGKSLATVSYYADPSIDIYGIDILNWSQRDSNMSTLGLEGRAHFIEGDSQQEALAWKAGREIDLLFIDANHEYYHVIADLLSWTPYLKHGGRLMLHDYDETSPGVMRAVHDFIYPHSCWKDYEKPGRMPGRATIFRATKV